jgi:hypothetical protein
MVHRSAGRPWKKVMDVSFTVTARLFAFDAFEFVAPKNALSNFAANRLQLRRQAISLLVLTVGS